MDREITAKLRYDSLYEADILVKFMSRCGLPDVMFSLQVDKSKFMVASCDILGYIGRAYALPACHGCLTNERELSSIVIVICPLTAIMLDQVIHSTVVIGNSYSFGSR